MTTTYDPRDPAYYDEADVREELVRVFDLCDGCRLCFNLCPAFPDLFDILDAQEAKTGATHGHATTMSPLEQDRIVDECYQCKLCYVKCPYVPPHEWELDFPRLMMRAHAQRVKGNELSIRQRVTSVVLGNTDLNGKISSAVAPLANVVMSPNSVLRRLMDPGLGIASERLLPPNAKQRFSTWFKNREAKRTTTSVPSRLGTEVQVEPNADSNELGGVSLFATCMVEYMEPDIGQDVVRVLEKNAIHCSLPAGVSCCGAPLLHSGRVDSFVARARQNVSALVKEVRSGKDIVVPQPTCGYVLKRDYPIYVGTPDSKLVAEHSYDAAEYMMKLHRQGTLDTDFKGNVPESITYHSACHLQAQNIGQKSRDLIKLTGSKVALVSKCSGIDGTWGYRSENYQVSKKVSKTLAESIRKHGDNGIAGDCHLANTSIQEELGVKPLHPIQWLARAYGLEGE